MKLILFVLAFIAISLESKAATFQLGNFPGSSSFGNADLNSGAVAPYNTLPSLGSFKDIWEFPVGANKGGASNVTITGINEKGITGLSVALVGVTNGGGSFYNSLYSSVTNELQGLEFGTLLTGNYSIVVSGTMNPKEPWYSYSGNLVIDGAPPSSVPVPAAVWLFGSALVGIAGLSRRGAK